MCIRDSMYFAPLLDCTERQRQLHDYAVALGRNALAGIRPALQACRVPTRIAWGGDDTIFSARSAHYLANSFGNFRGLRVLANARLFWPEERPVSYTHLRAHETPEHLVCRLL